MRKVRVIVVGAGTGGLCLAHGLRSAGIDVRVFERDRDPAERVQGYRLTINTQGARALRSCLPRSNFDHYVAASAKVSSAVNYFDHRLRPLLTIKVPAANQADPDAARPISRIALRQILLEGLEGVVEFGKTFERLETTAECAAARFEDGTRAEGDLLVGADGASSRIRRQLLPEARRIDTGVTMVTGKLPLDAEMRRDSPPTVFEGPTLIFGPRGGFMFAGAVEYPRDASPNYDQSEYVMWGFSAPNRTWRPNEAAEHMEASKLRAAVLTQIADWSPALRCLVELASSSSLSAFAVKSSVPVPPWRTSRATLLGDALHNMTPYRGVGANTALRDAALLRDRLKDVVEGRAEILAALSNYERAMIDYGFSAVNASLTQLRRANTLSPLARFATLSLFRLLNHAPPIKQRMLGPGV